MQAPKKPAPKKGVPTDPTHPRDLNAPLNPPSQISRVRFSPDGKLLAAACFDAIVRRWDVSGETPKELPALAGHGGWVTGIAFAPDRLYSIDSWGKLIGFNPAEEKPLWTVDAAHDGWVRSVAVSPDGATVATTGRDGFVRFWSAKDGQRTGEFSPGSDPMSVCFAPDGKSVLVGVLHGLVHVVDLASKTTKRSLEVKELFASHRIQEVGGVRVITFDAAGKRVAIAGGTPTTGGFVQSVPTIVIFDWATGMRTSTHKGEGDKEGYATDVRWHPSGEYFMATSSGQPGNGKVMFWRPKDEKPFYLGQKPNCHSLDLHPDGKRLAVAATNANSSGNGRPKNKDGSPDYPANNSPIHLYEMPGTKA